MPKISGAIFQKMKIRHPKHYLISAKERGWSEIIDFSPL
jgi:hypothetical protein